MKKFALSLVLALLALPAGAEEPKDKKVMITSEVLSIDLAHRGEKVTLMRNQDREAKIDPLYQPMHRGRIQPMNPFQPHQVDVLGELELIEYLKLVSSGDESVLVIDSRTPAWVRRGTIPGAVSIPFTEFKEVGQTLEIMEERFDVSVGEALDFSYAKTLVMFCNGAWCPQSPTAIRKLLALGYPAAKIKYYRGGMQSWQSLGLTVVMP